jgi:hypothetical protein
MPEPTAAGYRPTLTLQVLWSGAAESDDGTAALARALYTGFARPIDAPLERGLGIPVFFHTQPPTDAALLEAGEHTVLVVLVDDPMVVDAAWGQALDRLWRAVGAAAGRHRLYAVALTPNAFNISRGVATSNFIRLQRLPEAQRADRLLRDLTHELCRLLLSAERSERGAVPAITRLSPAPVMLFLSHAKQDGEVLAEVLRDHVESTSAVQSFFDANDIAPGFDFRSELEGNIERSVLVVLQTDAYGSRAWCRREVLWAKRKGCPLVIANALRKGEQRSFPYLGNAPSLRIDPDDPHWCDALVTLALREMLGHLWFRATVRDYQRVGLIPTGWEAAPSPPEVLTLADRRASAPLHLVYPDPPLGVEERTLLEQAAPPASSFTTPTSCAGRAPRADPALPLADRLIGLSISDSPDLARHGMGPAHLQDALLEVSRYLLSQGAALAYGGDLRPDGFTRRLLDLVWAHNSALGGDDVAPSPQRKSEIAATRLRNYVAWPIHLRYTVHELARYHLDGVFELVAPPADLGLDVAQTGVFVPPDSPEHRYWWYRSLTAMRERMAADIHARVLLGGQVRGFAGGLPGLLEEALLALRRGRPLYLLGGMGGCTRAVIDALLGRRPDVFTEAYQSRTEGYAAFLRYAEQRGDGFAVDYPAGVAELEGYGPAGLNNGLDEAENRLLFDTPHIPLMVSLVLEGLTRLERGTSGGQK